MDHNKPITVPVGCDALGQIGKNGYINNSYINNSYYYYY